MSKVATGNELGEALLKAFGLDARRVTKVVLTCEANNVAQVALECVPDVPFPEDGWAKQITENYRIVKMTEPPFEIPTPPDDRESFGEQADAMLMEISGFVEEVRNKTTRHCPYCGNALGQGHHPDCEFGKFAEAEAALRWRPQAESEPFAYAYLQHCASHLKKAHCGTVYSDPGDGRSPLYLGPQPSKAPDEVAEEISKDAELYRALRAMNWNDKKLCVTEAKNVRLGSDCPSGDRLDEAIESFIFKAPGALPLRSNDLLTSENVKRPKRE